MISERDPWFESLAGSAALSPSELLPLQRDGFVVTRGPVLATDLPALSRAYDSAVFQADRVDVREGSTTTRVLDFVNRGPEFDALYLHTPLLEACCKVIKEPFRLSTLVARTLNPGKVPKRL